MGRIIFIQEFCIAKHAVFIIALILATKKPPEKSQAGIILVLIAKREPLVVLIGHDAAPLDSLASPN
jgi:hypothetical protein